ncbi:MAG: DsbA family protein [Hyphomicrobiales bacterium]|nr:DsbA family protein [Hyphomicrobiales bacterium]
MTLKRFIFAGLAVAAMATTAFAPSQAQEKTSFDDAQKQEIQAIIKDYLLTQPEILREAIEELNRREAEVAEKERLKALASLYKEETPFSSGDGKVTMVEFFDYNCGYCRKAFEDIVGLSEESKDLRVVFVEFPILSEESRIASEAAVASTKQGKYFEYHAALMRHNGRVDGDVAMKIAADVGLDVEKLKEDMKAPEVAEIIEKNLQLGTSIGVQGTPAIFIGDEAIPGAPDNLREILKTAVTDINQNGCSVC